jgi:hypothetical protein
MVLVHMPCDAAMGACLELQRRQHILHVHEVSRSTASPKPAAATSMQTRIDMLPCCLLAQVTDIIKGKEAGKYARWSMITVLQHGYQGRVGVMTAGNYGTPQVSCADLCGFLPMLR